MKRPFPSHGLAQPFSRGRGGALLAVVVFLATGAARGTDLPPSYTFDLPMPANLATPAWLGHPDTPDTAFAEVNLPILTPETTASLLVTVYFQEKESGFMRVIWKGTQGAQSLSDNFYEGTGMENQRSLLISPQTLLGDGILTFQCGDASLGIRRVKMEWLEETTELASRQVRGTTVTPENGITLAAAALDGQAPGARSAAWAGQVVIVPLADTPQRIEDGVEFSVDLDKVPGVARLAVKEAGLPLGQHLVVWVNEQRAGTITPSVPDLLDPGFIADANDPNNYMGWREGSFFVPVSLLKPGENAVQFSHEDDAASVAGTTARPTSAAAQPLALKDIDLEFSYPALSSDAPGVSGPSSAGATSSEINPQ